MVLFWVGHDIGHLKRLEQLVTIEGLELDGWWFVVADRLRSTVLGHLFCRWNLLMAIVPKLYDSCWFPRDPQGGKGWKIKETNSNSCRIFHITQPPSLVQRPSQTVPSLAQGKPCRCLVWIIVLHQCQCLYSMILKKMMCGQTDHHVYCVCKYHYV